MRRIALFVALLVIAAGAMAAWAYGAHLTAVVFFPYASPRPIGEMVVSAIAGAIAAAAVASLPLGLLFRQAAWRVAFFVSGPMLFLRVPELFSYSGPLGQQTRGMALFELVTYVLALVAGAGAASKGLQALTRSSGPPPAAAELRR